MAVASRHTGKCTVSWNSISVGTRLKVHDIDWFDKNSSKYGEYGGHYKLTCTLQDGSKMEVNFTKSMIDRCGRVVTVVDIRNMVTVGDTRNKYIVVDGLEDFCWYPEMFECVMS